MIGAHRDALGGLGAGGAAEPYAVSGASTSPRPCSSLPMPILRNAISPFPNASTLRACSISCVGAGATLTLRPPSRARVACVQTPSSTPSSLSLPSSAPPSTIASACATVWPLAL
jgi:hypothetical protein